jgi:hypothetical protein
VSYDASSGVADVRKIFTADGPARGLIVSRDLLEAVVRPTERYDAPDGSLEYYALLTVLWYGHVLAAIDSWDNMIAERLGLEESAPFDPFGRPLQGGASHPSAATIVYFSPTTGWHHTSLASASMSLPAPYFAVDVELRQAVETAESHRADDRRLRETLASPAASAMP